MKIHGPIFFETMFFRIHIFLHKPFTKNIFLISILANLPYNSLIERYEPQSAAHQCRPPVVAGHVDIRECSCGFNFHNIMSLPSSFRNCLTDPPSHRAAAAQRLRDPALSPLSRPSSPQWSARRYPGIIRIP